MSREDRNEYEDMDLNETQESRPRRRTQAARMRSEAEAQFFASTPASNRRPVRASLLDEEEAQPAESHDRYARPSDSESSPASRPSRKSASRYQPAKEAPYEEEDPNTDDFFDEDDDEEEEGGGGRRVFRWIIILLIIAALLGGATYIGLQKPEWVEGAIDWVRDLTTDSTPAPTPTIAPTATPTLAPTPTPAPPAASMAAVISVKAEPEVQPDLSQPITFTVTTTYTTRIQVVDEFGKLLLEETREEGQGGDTWNLMLYFDEYYEGLIEICPGNVSGWNDVGAGSLRIKVGEPEAEETLPPADPAVSSGNSTADSSVSGSASSAVEAGLIALSGQAMVNDEASESYQRETPIHLLSETSARAIKGVTTFRSGAYRNNAAYGSAEVTQQALQVLWSYQLPGGVGWTGQPLIVQWPSDIRALMTLKDGMADRTALKEVILSSTDGNVYFLDLETGAETREALAVGVPLYGTPAVHPDGYPLLFVGMGAADTTNAQARTTGLGVYNLLTRKLVCLLDGVKSTAYSADASFIASPVVDGDTSTLIAAGSNGLLYTLNLNPSFDESRALSIAPSLAYYRAQASAEDVSVDTSPAIWDENAYFVTDGGILQCVNLNTMSTVWALNLGADADASPAVEEGSLYIATRADTSGTGKIMRIDPLSGEILWSYGFSGNAEASPVVGSGVLADYVIYTVSNADSGSTVYAFQKISGEVAWSISLAASTVSSPLVVYGSESGAWLLQGDSMGSFHLIDCLSATAIGSLDLSGAIVGSPAAFNNTIVVATESGMVYGIQIQ